MANHKSAEKRIRRNERVRRVRQSRRSRIRSFARRVEEAIVAGDGELARTRLRELQPEIHRGVNKGVIHRNAAARKLS
ncbi:MAG: 30S ribosomal protein S20, partial [Alphaproteobacteria bacterium]|nr:30S ribosomal protein S20 [Alphaproteobacteria bacterium]